jgi:hypothetical protein
MTTEILSPHFGSTPVYSVSNANERNDIPNSLRIAGMLCFTGDDRSTWQLLPQPWSGTNNDWVLFSAGGSGFSVGPRVFTWILGVGADLATGTDLTNWLICSGPGSFLSVSLVAKTGPVGSSIIVDILKSSNGGVSFTSLWAISLSNRPTIADGANVGTYGALDTTAFAANDILRIDVIHVGTTTAGQDLTVELLGSMNQ